MRLVRMKFKRVLVFFFLLFVVMSSYMYYSLFFSPKHDSRASVEDFEIHHKNHAPPRHRDEEAEEDNREAKKQPGLLNLFPHGVQKLWNGRKQPEREDSGEEDTHEDRHGHREEDRHGSHLKNVMKKQQQIIEKQAELLKHLEKKAALLAQQRQVEAGRPKPLFGGAQELPHKPRAHYSHDVRGQEHGGSGKEGENHVMKLAIHGIQPRRKIDFGRDEDHQEHAPGGGHMEGHGGPHRPPHMLRPPFKNPDDEEEDEGAEKLFHEAGLLNPNAMKGPNTANMLGKGHRLNIPQEAHEDGEGAEGMFHQLVKNNPNANAAGQPDHNNMFPKGFHNQHPGHAPAAMGADRQQGHQPAAHNPALGGGPHPGAIDAQRMFHDSARNNPLQNIPDHHQFQAGHAHRPGGPMNRAFRRRHIASVDSQGKDLHPESGLLAERFRHVPKPLDLLALRPDLLKHQNKTGFNEALKLYHQMHRAERFDVEVKDLTVPVNSTVKCIPIRMTSLARHLCVYPYDVDTKTSRQLIRTGTFNEEQELREFGRALATDESLAAVDIGAALGIYSLLAAGKSRQVLAVEPMKDHQSLFTKTMQINFLTKQVTLVGNALGEKKQFGLIRSPHPTGNMGAVYVDPITDWSKISSDVTHIVRMLRLDDLLPVIKFKSAVMKLDAQGDEEMVLRGANKFFDTVDVRYVLMHWLPTFNRDHLNECLMFLMSRGYVPTDSVQGNKIYSAEELQKDINFVVWRKNRP